MDDFVRSVVNEVIKKGTAASGGLPEVKRPDYQRQSAAKRLVTFNIAPANGDSALPASIPHTVREMPFSPPATDAALRKAGMAAQGVGAFPAKSILSMQQRNETRYTVLDTPDKKTFQLLKLLYRDGFSIGIGESGICGLSQLFALDALQNRMPELDISLQWSREGDKPFKAKFSAPAQSVKEAVTFLNSFFDERVRFSETPSALFCRALGLSAKPTAGIQFGSAGGAVQAADRFFRENGDTLLDFKLIGSWLLLQGNNTEILQAAETIEKGMGGAG